MAVLRLPSDLPTPDAISPELALVCPDLRAQLAELLPDRPWELLLPIGSPPEPPTPALRVVPVSASAAATVTPEPRRRRRPPYVSLILVGAMAAALVVTGLLPARDAPTLAAPPAAPAPAPSPAPAPAPAAPLAPPVVPGGLYVVDGGSGKLRVAADGASFEATGLDVACLGRGASIRVPVLPDASFGVLQTRHGRAGAKTVVEVAGRFEATSAVGTVRVRSARCDSRQVPLAATLSADR